MHRENPSASHSTSGAAEGSRHHAQSHDIAIENAYPSGTRGHQKLGNLFTLLCLVGLAVAVELTRIHVFVHTDPSYHSICAVSEGVNCETVALSPYSVFAGLPVSIWGVAGYLLMGALSLTAHKARSANATWPFGFLLTLTSCSVATSVLLAAISVTQIDSLCLFCMASYAINVALFAITIVVWKRSGLSPLNLFIKDVESLLCHPRAAVAAGIVEIVALATAYGYVPAYWKSPGWSDLPKLATGTNENGNHWVGATNPKLTIVEFSDYECPHCRSAHKAMRTLAAKHVDQVRLVHRHLPLDQACHVGLRRPFHTHACLFAEAAECAGEQGRFWEMNDALFSSQDTIKAVNIVPIELAVRLGLNSAEFKRCLGEHSTAKRIAADVKESMALKLSGTPSFVVNGKLFPGRISDAQLDVLLASVR